MCRTGDKNGDGLVGRGNGVVDWGHAETCAFSKRYSMRDARHPTSHLMDTCSFECALCLVTLLSSRESSLNDLL